MGGFFYQRKEIKDILAYCRLVIAPMMKKPSKNGNQLPNANWLKTSLDHISLISNEQNIGMWKVISSNILMNLPINAGAKNKIRSFVDMIPKLSIDAEQKRL